MVDLSIIIVNYNTGEYLTRCVKSIIESGYKLSRIQFIIIDNASKDNSIELTKNLLSISLLKKLFTTCTDFSVLLRL